MPTPLRVGLIGAGSISGAHMRAYTQFPQHVQLIAVADPHAAAARERALSVGIDTFFTDPYAMLQHADIDAVDICTPHDLHAPLAIAAAEAGKHILVEKPMACSLEECHAMIAAAERAGVTLMVAQHQRYVPSYAGVRHVIRSGELGAICAVRMDAMQHMPAFATPSHWLYDGSRAGGGIIISVLVHRLDLVRYLVGEVKRVTAVCRTTRPEFINGAEDFAAAVLEFENRAIGELFATYSGFRMPWGEQFMIFGAEGTIHAVPPSAAYVGPAFIASRERVGEPDGWDAQFTGFVPVPPHQGDLPTEDGFVNEILHFAACCQSGQEPLSSGRDNVNTMKIVFGIYESARRGEPIELERL